MADRKKTWGRRTVRNVVLGKPLGGGAHRSWPAVSQICTLTRNPEGGTVVDIRLRKRKPDIVMLVPFKTKNPQLKKIDFKIIQLFDLPNVEQMAQNDLLMKLGLCLPEPWYFVTAPFRRGAPGCLLLGSAHRGCPPVWRRTPPRWSAAGPSEWGGEISPFTTLMPPSMSLALSLVTKHNPGGGAGSDL